MGVCLGQVLDRICDRPSDQSLEQIFWRGVIIKSTINYLNNVAKISGFSVNINKTIE